MVQLTQEAIRMPRESGFKLDAMSLPELLRLRERIQAALANKIEQERQELEQRMKHSALDLTGGGSRGVVGRGRRSRVSARSMRGNGRANPLKGRTVAPKYRDPENPSQTWAGRGQAPRWLTAYEQQGRKRDEFLIGATQGAATKGRRKKRA
jgi:DNA-binding protein H-NS